MKILLALFLVLLFRAFSPASAVSNNGKGNKEFKKGRFAEAETLYRVAEIEAPEKKEIVYNLGNAYYRANDFQNAEKAYEKARDIKDKKMRKKILFNMGNNFFREGANAQDESGQQKVEQAVKTYKELLKYDPSDYAAKYNLERALEKIEQMKKQQQSKDPKKDQNRDKNKDENKDQSKDQDKKDKQNQRDKNKKDEQDKQDRKQEDKNQNKQAENKEEQKPPETKAPQPKKPGELSEEEAKRLLDALKQDETDMQKRLMLMRVPAKKREKDW